MARALLIFPLVFFMSASVYAQTDTLVWHDDIQLQAGDFRNKSPEQHLDISYHFEYQLMPGSFYRWTPVFRSRAVFNRKTSSMGESTTRDALRYAQVVFDLYGLHVLRLESKIYDMGSLGGYLFKAEDEIAYRIRETEKDLEKEIEKLNREIQQAVNMGESTNRVFSEWEQKIKSSLKTTDRIRLREETGWGMSFFIGMGYSLLSGKTGACFTDPTALSLGLQFDDKKRSRFGVDIRLGVNKTLQPLQFKGDWEKGLRTNLANIEFTYGYRVPVKKILFVPYGGVAVNEFSPRKSDNSDKRRIDGYSPVVGLEFNHFVAGINKNPRETVKFFYKCKASYNPSNFVRSIAGPQLNFSLTLGFDTVPKRLKMVREPAAG